MAITLNWTNKNSNVTNFKVYRGPKRDALSLLTTLAASALSYQDTSAANNTLYYYQINVVIGGSEEVPGAITPYAVVTDTGPGPQLLASGTMEFGYFGQLSVNDFISSADIQAAITVGAAYSTATTSWYKLACNGKVLFVPSAASRTVTTSPVSIANALYNAGSYLGTGAATVPHAAVTAGSTPVLQNKKMTFGAYEFYLRMPKGQQTVDQASNATVNTSVPIREVAFSEASLIASLNTSWQPLPAYMAQGLMPSQVMTAAGTLIQPSAVSSFITQHWTSNVAHVAMGTGGTVMACLQATNATASNTYYLLPVLELITGS